MILILSGISRFLLIEEAFDVDIGHADTEAMVEDQIRELEGERHESAASATRPTSRLPARRAAKRAAS